MSFSKRLEEARKAFGKQDLDASALAHQPDQIAKAVAHKHNEEHGGEGSQYLGEMVYGGLDGIVTTFAVVSGVAGAQLSSGIILIMGLANLFADGFSMATGAYLSTRSEHEVYRRERSREDWEVEHVPEGEAAELYEIYLAKGYPEADARQLVEIHSRDPKRWVDAMMVDELEMLPESRNPLRIAMATLVAFIVAGAVPLLVYLLGLFTSVPADWSFPISMVLSGLALFALGAAKVLVTRLNPWRSGLEMLLVGGLAAGVAYLVGALLAGLGG